MYSRIGCKLRIFHNYWQNKRVLGSKKYFWPKSPELRPNWKQLAANESPKSHLIIYQIIFRVILINMR